MGSLGWPEMLIIGIIIIVLFGSRRIPEVAKGLGEGIRNFKTGLHGDEHESIDDRGYHDAPRPREERHRSV